MTMRDAMCRQPQSHGDTLFDAMVLHQKVSPGPCNRPMAQTSIDAGKKVDRGADYLLILRDLNSRRVDGLTHAEWCVLNGRESSTSGRFTELAAAERMRKVGLATAARNRAKREGE